MLKAWRLKNAILIALGISLSSGSLILMSNFMQSLRSVMMLGSRLEPDGAMVQAIAATAILLALFAAGLIMVAFSVKAIIRGRPGRS